MKRILRYFRAKRFDRELAQEMQAHLEEKIDDLLAAGLRPQEAREQALRGFGNRTRLAERAREQWAFLSLDEIAQDLRYAVRVLARTPAFTAIAVLSLALGIGANTVIFSAVDHVLLNSLPYKSAQQLYAVWSRSASHGAEPMHVSPADFYDWQSQSHAFESVAAYANWPMNLTDVDEPQRLQTQLVSANLFSTLGVHTRIGRTFLPGEDQEQSPFVVVISDRLWRILGESPQIIGRKLTLNGNPATVIGVMPAGFAFPSHDADAWTPLSLSAKNRADREGRWLKVIGRLRANATAIDAMTELDVITRRLAAAYPATNAGWSVSIIPLQDELVGKTRPILVVLQAGALLLLAIACANLANLLLARGASRSREIGLRAALGAGRSRIIQQLVIESSVVAVLGGAIGIVLAAQTIALLRTFGEGLLPRIAEIRLSPDVALFAIAVTLLTTIAFGLAPALHASRMDLRSTISSGARGTAGEVENKRGLLVSLEIGFAAVLLIGAGLLGGSLVRLLSIEPGLKTDHALTVQLTLPRSQYPTNTAQNAFFQNVLERVRSIPGVVSAGEVSETPLKGNNPSFQFVLDGVRRGSPDAPLQAGMRAISGSYLRAAGIPLLEGRDVSVDDRPETSPIAIINQTMARLFWPGADPIGKRLRFKDEQRWITVAGVVADIKHMGLTTGEGGVIYIPYSQKTQDWLAWTTLFVRTSGEPLAMVPAIRAAVRAIDKNQPVAEIATLDEVLDHLTAMPRFTTTVMLVASCIAVVIAVIGVYGLVSYTVARRLREFGIRFALGASSVQVTVLLLRQVILRVLAGVGAGLVAAFWLAQFLETMLFDVGPHDPAAFAGAAGLLIFTSLVAVVGPLRRAIKADPAATLRFD